MHPLYTLRCNLVNTSRCLTASALEYNFDYMTLASRIKAAREHADLTQIELSQKVRLPQQTISKLENGLQLETAGIVKIAVACGVNPVWLDTGDGDMFIYSSDPKIQAVNLAMMKMEEPEKDFIVTTSTALAKQTKTLPGKNGTQ